jgi:uncharacterized protein
MDMDKCEHGVPSWVDLGTPDPAASAAFYSSLWGWDVQVGPPETGGYGIAHIRGRSVAGIGPQQNPGPPVWATYVNVDNADDVAAKVTANGGTMFMEPFDVMDVGRMAFFADPAGAIIGMWQPMEHKGAGIVNENGTYCWSELVTTDLEGAKTFYGAVFGWGPGGVPEYTEWQVGGRSVGGGMLKPPQMPAEVPNHWAVYFAVDDTDATVARVNELGGSTIMPPMDIEPGRFAVLADPQGAVFNVLKLKQAAG